MLDSIIPLFGTFLGSGLWSFFFVPFLALAVVATIPCLLRYLLSCRRA